MAQRGGALGGAGAKEMGTQIGFPDEAAGSAIENLPWESTSPRYQVLPVARSSRIVAGCPPMLPGLTTYEPGELGGSWARTGGLEIAARMRDDTIRCFMPWLMISRCSTMARPRSGAQMLSHELRETAIREGHQRAALDSHVCVQNSRTINTNLQPGPDRQSPACAIDRPRQSEAVPLKIDFET